MADTAPYFHAAYAAAIALYIAYSASLLVRRRRVLRRLEAATRATPTPAEK